MSPQSLSADRIDAMTVALDIEAAPPDDLPTALFVFGTSQVQPAEIATEWYRRGLAQLIIVTGGVNRHNGFVEGREFHRLLVDRGVPASVIRCEAASANAWQNVEFSLRYLREARDAGLTLTAVGKWYHRSTVHCLATLVPDIGRFHAISWAPVYDGHQITRRNWPRVPSGERRVRREWEEVSRRVADGSFRDIRLVDGAWHC